ncbi:MAG: DUF3570 domain-containing protein [Saprospiraceae bacterium]
MKKKYIVFGAMAMALGLKAQKPDTAYQKKTLSKTDIEAVFSYYGQDGNNSAVTGGTGTEKLTVYAPNLKIAHHFKGRNTLAFSGGVDVITSASTDNIDFVVSSASRVDARSHADFDYRRELKNAPVGIAGGAGFSLESDYLSLPFRLGLDYTAPSQMNSFQLAFQANFDDLRWGRLNEDYKRPVTLVYPVELRGQEWFDIYRRNSYTLKMGFSQVVNKRLILAIFPEVHYQKGLLSTPFHRVYFNDGSLKVENLPRQRWKLPVGLQANYFLGSRMVLKGNYSFYTDDFGITAHAFQVENTFKISPAVALSALLRYYTQKASRYFKPFEQHEAGENFYTSDYDLAGLGSWKLGVNARLAPFWYVGNRCSFNEVNIRYAWYHRSNGLEAHILTFSFGLSIEGKKGKNR